MSNKFKAFGFCLIAAVAMSVAAVMSASAETGGHFISEVAHTELKGAQVETNKLNDPTLGAVQCKQATFSGTVNSTTTTQITIIPTYHECSNGERGVTVDMNGCDYVFTIRGQAPAERDNTVHLTCPVGKQVEVTVFTNSSKTTLSCTETIRAQTPTGGVVYTTGGSGTSHDILADLTIEGIHIHRHAAFVGGCLFAATTVETATLTGTATMQGSSTAGASVGITATGL